MAIAFDASTAMSVSSGTSQTLSHTCGAGSNRILFVYALVQGSQTTSSVTYGGVAMTKINSLQNSNVSPNEEISLWYLVNPASGANNIVGTFTGSATNALGATSFTGSAQSGQPDSNNTNANAGSTTSVTVSTTTVADNSWLVGFLRVNSGTLSAGSNTTIRSGTNLVIVDSNAAQTPAGSKSFNATNSISQPFNALMASFSPVGASSTPSRLALLGVR